MDEFNIAWTCAGVGVDEEEEEDVVVVIDMVLTVAPPLCFASLDVEVASAMIAAAVPCLLVVVFDMIILVRRFDFGMVLCVCDFDCFVLITIKRL